VWVNRSGETCSIEVVGAAPCHPALKAAMIAAEHGLAAGLRPQLAEEGLGGTYFLREPSGARRRVAVFKPAEEEPFAPHNPRGQEYVAPMGSPGMRPGTKSGEANLREVVAFILDSGGLAGVPPTARVEIRCPFYGEKAKVSTESS